MLPASTFWCLLPQVTLYYSVWKSGKEQQIHLQNQTAVLGSKRSFLSFLLENNFCLVRSRCRNEQWMCRVRWLTCRVKCLQHGSRKPRWESRPLPSRAGLCRRSERTPLWGAQSCFQHCCCSAAIPAGISSPQVRRGEKFMQVVAPNLCV